VSDEELHTAFAERDLAPPLVVEADAGDPEATVALMERIAATHGRLDAVISNVALAKPVDSLDALKRSSFELSLRYTAWPVVDLVQACRRVIGELPRYVVGVSSLGAEVCPDGYDVAGAAKASLEMLCRYLAMRLRPHGTRVNVLRTGFLDTQSSRATFGDRVIDTLAERDMVLDPAGAARACVALCSGWLDAVTGQTLVADEGWSLADPIFYVTGRGFGGHSTKRGEP
jgi:NAD(P)-dependent dehydrogenase (short-subunit alcohol dehydrogenase family)